MIQKRRSKIEGWGVFATQPIAKNKRIVEYTGEKISNRESLKREIRYLKKGHIWCFKLNRLYVRDAAVGGNIARFINHACKPNCYTAGRRADHLGARRAQHQAGRRADLRLLDRRREDDRVPLPSRVHHQALIDAPASTSTASRRRPRSSKAAYFGHGPRSTASIC